ncbi:MAG TPA: hypothetical protein VK081_02720 [Planctomycetota bacterium]|nr:hypothetical protein [Planctomycetota bacterium]
MVLALILATVFALQIAWAVHQIRRDLSLSGMRVERVRWLPLAPLLSFRGSRSHMIYRVWFADGRGTRLTCLAVVSVFGGVVFEEQRELRQHSSMQTAAPAEFPWSRVAWAVLACVVLGVRYWSASYGDLHLPDDLLQPELGLVVVLAGWLRFAHPTRTTTTLALMALAPVGTVVVRIVIDLARDPTSHNLFPVELVIAAVVGLLAAGLGVGLGALARRLAPPATGALRPAAHSPRAGR